MITVAIIAVLAALAIYGITIYLSSAKTSEAKTAIGAISRAAVSAFEREVAKSEELAEGSTSSVSSHVLCASAVTVPATVPKATKYQPNSANGTDYETGDESTGWRCLKYATTQASYYQYGYTRDGSPLAPTNPSKCETNCFEAGARGNLDGDANESSFAITGHINLTTGRLRTTVGIFADNENE